MQVFFSYSQADEEFARLLAKEMGNRGLRTWMPSNEVLPGDNPWLKIGKALENSHALVVLLSPESAKSELLNSELSYALGNLNFRGRVFPILVRPTTKIPWILKQFQIFETGKTNSKRDAGKIAGVIAERLKQVA
jgi:TIR domain